jgi:hypothetical protein
MKTRILMLTIATAGLLSVGTETAPAQLPVCPPFCAIKRPSESKTSQAPKPKPQKKVKKEQAA